MVEASIGDAVEESLAHGKFSIVERASARGGYISDISNEAGFAHSN